MAFKLVKRDTGCGNWNSLSAKLELDDKRYIATTCSAECGKRDWCTHFYVGSSVLSYGKCSLVPDECTEATWTAHDHYALVVSKGDV